MMHARVYGDFGAAAYVSLLDGAAVSLNLQQQESGVWASPADRPDIHTPRCMT